MPFLGAHESVSGGLHLAFERIAKVGGEALQIFTRNQRQWNSSVLTAEEILAFGEEWQKVPDIEVVSHASYLINLASAKPELQEKSIRALAAELERCQLLNIPAVVLHPGSHGGDGVEVGLQRFNSALDRVFAMADLEVKVLIETTAGQGTGLGSRFEEIAAILESSRYQKRLGVCVDTCHIFAAGYDIRTRDAYEETMSSFDRIVGLEKIDFFHLNDSKKELGSRVDRHEHIGKGFIGIEGFTHLLNDPTFAKHSMTLETPKGKELLEDRENLHRLRKVLELVVEE